MSELLFVSFKRTEGRFIAYVPVNQLLSADQDKDTENILHEAVDLYEQVLTNMKSALEDIDHYRKNHKFLPAKIVWKLGNIIFNFVEMLEKNGLQIDGIYEHFERDLDIKRKWLEKVITFRRYIPNENIIPMSMNWGYFEKGTRRKAVDFIENHT